MQFRVCEFFHNPVVATYAFALNEQTDAFTHRPVLRKGAVGLTTRTRPGTPNAIFPLLCDNVYYRFPYRTVGVSRKFDSFHVPFFYIHTTDYDRIAV